MKCVGYIRVSKEEQTHGYSLEAQRERIEAFSKANSMTLTGFYADEGISASKALQKRKGILQLLDDAEAGMFDCVLFKDITRWSRNPSQFYAVQDRLDKAKVSWIAVEQPNLETVTAQGRLLVGIFISVASHESAQIGERIKFVNEARVRNGGLIGGNRSLPIGYETGIIDGKKCVVVKESEREAVKDAFDTYLSEMSVGAVRKRLQEYGIYRTDPAVRNMLSNEMYLGHFHGNDHYCEPLIDMDTWQEVQTMRKQRTYTSPKHNEYVFSGLVKCKCGRTMVGTTQKKWKYYVCKGYKNGLCDNKHIVSEKKLETFMFDSIKEDLKTYTVDITPKTKKRPSTASLKAKLDRLNELYIDGRITRKDYEQKRQEIEKELAYEPPKAKTLYFPNGWDDYYYATPVKDRNSAWRSIVDHITPTEDGFEVEFIP